MVTSYDRLAASPASAGRPKRRQLQASSTEEVLDDKRVYAKLIVDKTLDAKMVALAKKKCPSALTREEKIDVVLLQVKF